MFVGYHKVMFWGSIAFCILLLPLCCAVGFVPSIATQASNVVFGIPLGLLESWGWDNATQLLSPKSTVYMQALALSMIPIGPGVLAAGMLHYIDNGKCPTWAGNFLYVLFWVCALAAAGLLVWIFFPLASGSVLGSVETSKGEEGFFGWLIDFGRNMQNIYIWYLYPFIALAEGGLLVFCCYRCETAIGQNLCLFLLGPLLMVLSIYVFYVLGAILNGFIVIIAILVIVGGIGAGVNAAIPEKIHGHIYSDGDVYIDKW